jgi:hypothetical protein
MLIDKLPKGLEDAEKLLKRRQRAADIKEFWRSTYQEAMLFAMPTREQFSQWNEGAEKERRVIDSTLESTSLEAANMMVNNLFPAWQRWAEYSPGGDVPAKDATGDVLEVCQHCTDTFFKYLNVSAFNTVIHESAMDFQIGTAALAFDEGDVTKNEPLFKFSAVPISQIELEEGPLGTIETTWQCRKIKARNLLRTYDGLDEFELSPATRKAIEDDPDTEIEIVQGEVYDPGTCKYYGVALEVGAKNIIWRYSFDESAPMIVGRAMKLTGETFGRGRALVALRDARTLNKIQEFNLRHMALQVAPPFTAVSDSVFNPYTVRFEPASVIPVASNARDNPSLSVLPMGGNFQVADQQIKQLRDTVRRIMLGPEPMEGPVRSATEISVNNTNRMQVLNGEYSRILSEFAYKILVRGAYILRKNGKIPDVKVNGHEIAVSWTSPFAKSQASQDIMDFQEVMQTSSMFGQEVVQLNFKVEDAPAWIARKKGGFPEELIRSVAERQKITQTAAAVMQKQGAAQAAQQNPQKGQPSPQQQPLPPAPNPAGA